MLQLIVRSLCHVAPVDPVRFLTIRSMLPNSMKNSFDSTDNTFLSITQVSIYTDTICKLFIRLY